MAVAVAAKAKALVAVVLAFALSPKVVGLVVGAAVVAVDVAPNKNAPPVWVLVLVVVAVVVLLAGAELVAAAPSATPKTLVRPECVCWLRAHCCVVCWLCGLVGCVRSWFVVCGCVVVVCVCGCPWCVSLCVLV